MTGIWLANLPKQEVEEAHERYRKAWTLLADAVEASRQPAGVRAAAAW